MKKIVLILMILLLHNSLNAAELTILPGQEIIHKIDKDKHQYKILFFFVSWCNQCKTVMDSIIRTFSEESYMSNIYFISLDKNHDEINNFVDNLNNNINIYLPYNVFNMITIFQNYKIAYNNRIPHISVLNVNNELIADNISLKQAKAYIN
jgi:hypothetical protein